MKRIWMVLFAIITFIILPPITTNALKVDDPEFTSFLKEIGWKKQAYVDYLESKDWDLDYFDSVEELGTPLSEEDIQSVLEQFNLTRDELNALLIEFGDIYEGQDVLESEWIIFAEELGDYVDHYLNDYTPIDEDNLQELLTTYEFQSKEELNEFLTEYDDALEYYTYIEELEWTIEYYLYELTETPINEENLQELLEMYEFASIEELENFLNEHDDSIDYYTYIEDLDDAVYMLLYEDDFFELDEILAPLSDIGITEEEVERLMDHFLTLDIEDPDLLDKLFELEDKLTAFENGADLLELTESQIAEFTQIYNELIDLFEVNLKYYLIKADEKKSVTFATLMTMYHTDGYDFSIEIYNDNGELLADVLIPYTLLEETLNDELDFTEQPVAETNNNTPDEKLGDETTKEPSTKLSTKQSNDSSKETSKENLELNDDQTTHTVDGGELPNTAAFIGNYILIGILLLATGLFLYQRKKLSRR